MAAQTADNGTASAVVAVRRGSGAVGGAVGGVGCNGGGVVAFMAANSPNNNNNCDDGGGAKRPAERPLQHGCPDMWNWSKKHRSAEVVLSGPKLQTAFFHPNWSKGTAGVRGTKVLNNGRYYWEIHVTNRIFGTRFV